MQLAVRNFLGCERADIDVSKTALLIGPNGVGKSCIVYAFQALMTGEMIPVDNVLKKEIKDFVKDGSDTAVIRLVDGESLVEHLYPKGTRSTKGEEIFATRAAMGMDTLSKMDNKTLRLTLIDYLKAEPSKKELDQELDDLNCTAAEKLAIWGDVSTMGWDLAQTKVAEEGAKIKGQWEKLAGTKYNQTNVASWVPPMYHPGLEHRTLESLQNELNKAKQEREAMVKLGAVSEMERAVLAEEASKLDEALKEIKRTLEAKKKSEVSLREREKEREAHPLPASIVRPHPCPTCGTELLVGNNELVKYDGKGVTPKEVETARAAHEKLKAACQTARLAHEANVEAHARANDKANVAIKAKERLADIEKRGLSTDVPDFSRIDAQIETLERNLTASKDLAESKRLVNEIHHQADIYKLLAPAGLRQKILVTKLESLNTTLAELCQVAGWKTVSLSPELLLYYGNAKFWKASRSQKYRIKAALQCAFARLDGSMALCFDDNEELDTTAGGLNGLMLLIKYMGLPTLITRCINLARGEKYPNLKKMKLGITYRIENGVSIPVEEED